MRKEIVRCDICNEELKHANGLFTVDGQEIDICSAACWMLWWERAYEKHISGHDVAVTFSKKKFEVVKPTGSDYSH